MYTILVSVITIYTLLVIVYSIFSFYVNIKHRFSDLLAKDEICRKISKIFRGRKKVLLFLKLFSFAALISWLALSLPLLDFILNLDILSSYDRFTDTLTTPFKSFTGKEAGHYYLIVLFGIISAKGYFLINFFVDVLRKDDLAVSPMGDLGASDDFY